jgi:hypothetical protein
MAAALLVDCVDSEPECVPVWTATPVTTAAIALTATTASTPRLVAWGRAAGGLVSNSGHAISLVIAARPPKRLKRFAGARMTAASASGTRKGLRCSGASAEAPSG